MQVQPCKVPSASGKGGTCRGAGAGLGPPSSPHSAPSPGLHPRARMGEAVAAPRLGELRKRLDQALRHVLGFSGCPAQDQQSDSMILSGPFVLSVL